MPGIAAHMVAAKLVSEHLNITDPDFIRGNLLPDVLKTSDSHHKIRGRIYLIPDINYFIENFDFKSGLNSGYLCHLLLDKYFLEEFVPEHIENLYVFEEKIIYKEYDMINFGLVERFDLDVGYLKSILGGLEGEIDKGKLDLNLRCLSISEVSETQHLKLDEFSEFLREASIRIAGDLKAAAEL